MAAEERSDARNENEAEHGSKASSSRTTPDKALQQPLPPRPRLVFGRESNSTGWWLWDLFSGGGGKANQRRITPKGVLHQIAAETPSLAAVPSADLALEIVRRTLGIKLPGYDQGQEKAKRSRHGSGASESASVVAAPLTWELLEAAFEPVFESGAGQEGVALATRLDRGGMHNHALQVLIRVRALEARGLDSGARVPVDVQALATMVQDMEARRALVVAEAKERYALTPCFAIFPPPTKHC